MKYGCDRRRLRSPHSNATFLHIGGQILIVGSEKSHCCSWISVRATKNVEWTPGEDNEWRGACRLDFWRTQTQDKTTATMVYRPCLIHHERPPSRAGAAARGATNLISGLSVTFCGGAAVVGGSGAECGRFVVASVTIYTVKGRILEIPHQSTGGVFWRLHCASYA
jgi:hypothetical protein